MNKITLTMIIFLLSSNLTWAQSECEWDEQDNQDKQSEFSVTGGREVNVSGEAFYHYYLEAKKGAEKKTEQASPEISNWSITFNRAFFVTNIAGSSLALYGIYKMESADDKDLHMLAGYIVGNVTTGSLQLLLPKNMNHKKLWAMAGGIGMSALVGVAKEYRDSLGYGNVEAKDALATALGGVTGSFIMTIGDIPRAFIKKR